MRTKNNSSAILLALLFVLIAGFLFLYNWHHNPTDKTGTISGYVQDSATGAPLRGVDVTAADEKGELYTSHDNTDTTGQDGYFELELPPGEYTLQFEADRYESMETSGSYTVEEDSHNKISDSFSLKAAVDTSTPPAESVSTTPPAEPVSTTPPAESVSTTPPAESVSTTPPAESVSTTPPAEQKDSAAETSRDQSDLFTINAGQIEDYSQNLDPGGYLMYYSGTADFYFSYPPRLYNNVVSRFDSGSTALGTNIETHTFTGTGGSELTYSLARRTGNLNLKAEKDSVLAVESAEITDSRKVLLDEFDKKGGYARAVVTGFGSSGKIIYKLFKITPEYAMEMRITCPPYKDENDKLMKRYVQECIYRWCGFASDKPGAPRPYSEYIKSDKK